MVPAASDPEPRQAPAAVEAPEAASDAADQQVSSERDGDALDGAGTASAPEKQPLPRACPGAEAPEADGEVAAVAAKKNVPACYPEAQFVERLCAGNFPGAALVLFGKDSPWARMYMKGPGKAWSTAPGADQERMFFREEVLVLQDPALSKNSMSSEGASFYALRWNGSCVKLTEEELTDQPPWAKATPPVRWDWIDDNLQDELRGSDKIQQAVVAMKKDCKGARIGSKPPQCVKREQALSDLIVSHVRAGAQLPDPTLLP